MDVMGSIRSGPTGSTKPVRRWLVLTLAGGAAFWSANLVISLTSSAVTYRSVLSIQYLPMLVEAAIGGLVIAGAVALLLLRFPGRVPGGSVMRKALLLAGCALVALTVLIEVPSKLGADLDEPGRWLVVATAFNTIRVLSLGIAIGLVMRTQKVRAERHRLASKERKP
jgi:hypothetical protein